MRYYDINTESVVNFARLPKTQRYVQLATGGVKHYSHCSEDELSAAGFLMFTEVAAPPFYTPGAPLDTRIGDTITRTYPDPIFEPDPWRAQLTAAIQAKKVQKRDGGFLVDDVLFDSDAGANVAYLNFYTRITVDPDYSTPWKASGNTWVVMDAALFALVSAAFQANTEAAFGWQAQMAAALAEAPDTYAALSAIEALINA